jgi:hypothetical protein
MEKSARYRKDGPVAVVHFEIEGTDADGLDQRCGRAKWVTSSRLSLKPLADLDSLRAGLNPRGENVPLSSSLERFQTALRPQHWQPLST